MPQLGADEGYGVAQRVGPNKGGPQFKSYQVKQRWVISGITKDSAGVPLPFCAVHIFNTYNDTFIGEVVSNSLGEYEFTLDGNVNPKYCVAYLAGSPDVAGTTVNTLVPALI